jgi:hypothetical protein
MDVVTGNDPREQRTGNSAKITAVEAAWWLSTGEADPTLASRFMYGTPDEARRREHIAAQVGRLIAAADEAGISDALMGILTDLFRQPSPGR